MKILYKMHNKEILPEMILRMLNNSKEEHFEFRKVPFFKMTCDSLSKDMLNRKYKETNEFHKLFIEILDYFSKENLDKFFNKK